MPQVTKEILQELLEKCIAIALEDAQKQVSDPLSKQVYLSLEAFGQREKVLTLDEIMSFLYREGVFPKNVDIAVRGIKDGNILIWIRPSGHAYVSDFSQTWNRPAGMGPFKSIGLMLPHNIWKRPKPFSIQDLVEAGEKSE